MQESNSPDKRRERRKTGRVMGRRRERALGRQSKRKRQNGSEVFLSLAGEGRRRAEGRTFLQHVQVLPQDVAHEGRTAAGELVPLHLAQL